MAVCDIPTAFAPLLAGVSVISADDDITRGGSFLQYFVKNFRINFSANFSEFEKSGVKVKLFKKNVEDLEHS